MNPLSKLLFLAVAIVAAPAALAGGFGRLLPCDRAVISLNRLGFGDTLSPNPSNRF